LVVPVARRHKWNEIKKFCKMVADSLVREAPERYTSTMSKTKRTRKIFIDYLRNARGATAVAAYSTRAKPGAPISTPLDWEELTTEIRSDHFTIRNLPERLSGLRKDP
jgi:bifunctional non-homologous end joining protein LigD